MRISPFTKKIQVDDATFFVNVSYHAKRAFAECLKLGQLAAQARSGALDAEEVEVNLSDLEISRLVDVLVDHRCIAGWEGVEVEKEDGSVTVLPHSHENVKALPYPVLIELATQTMNHAFQQPGNATGSESK